MKLVALLALFAPLCVHAHPFDNLAAELAETADLVDASRWPDVELDIRYATDNNFTHRNVYGPFRSCFLHSEAAEKLRKSLAALRAKKPGWKLRVFDCLRPVRAQARLFAVVRGTPQQKYVLNPKYGSLHSYGFAIDLSLENDKGQPLDMGTGFDYFGAKAEPQREAALLAAGELTQTQIDNRKLLRSILQAGGFRAISTEWWHFDALDGDQVRANYDPVE